MEYDSQSEEAKIAFDAAYAFYRTRDGKPSMFDIKQAYMCGIISLDVTIHEMIRHNIDRDVLHTYHRAKELLTVLMKEK